MGDADKGQHRPAKTIAHNLGICTVLREKFRGRPLRSGFSFSSRETIKRESSIRGTDRPKKFQSLQAGLQRSYDQINRQTFSLDSATRQTRHHLTSWTDNQRIAKV